MPLRVNRDKATKLELVRRLTRETGTLLAIDETHTLVTAYAGLGRMWELEPDLLTIGKSMAAGVPLAAYGMTDALAAHTAPPAGSNVVSGAVIGELATWDGAGTPIRGPNRVPVLTDIYDLNAPGRFGHRRRSPVATGHHAAPGGTKL